MGLSHRASARPLFRRSRPLAADWCEAQPIASTVTCPHAAQQVYFDMADGRVLNLSCSDNLTGFALLGLNGEAGILLQGPSNSPEFIVIRNDIDESVAQSFRYLPE